MRTITSVDFERARTANVGTLRYTTFGTGPAARELSVTSFGAMRFGTITDKKTLLRSWPHPDTLPSQLHTLYDIG